MRIRDRIVQLTQPRGFANRHPYFHGFGLFAFPGPPTTRWTVGWLTGRDSDLVCVKRNVTDTCEGELALSPVCANPFLAALAYLLKRTLLAVDLNCR